MKEAEERAWSVVQQAFEERLPTRRTRVSNSLLLALVLLALAVAAAVVSPPGRAVFKRVREAVGVPAAEPALFSLPAKGSLLVVSGEGGGVWLVRDNGFKRRIGSYTDAEWSPHGLFVVATTARRLVALDLDTGVRWSLPRRAAWPRWEGTRADTRVAYLTPTGLRVVAGDGTGDHLLDRDAQDVPPAWDPARLHTVAYFSGRAIVLRRADSRALLWRAPVTIRPSNLGWSPDGRYLAVVSPQKIVVLDRSGRVHRTVTTLGERFVDAAFEPGTHELALSLRAGQRSELRLVDVDHPGRARLLFAGPGAFGDFAWSPDGRWLVLSWPTADQWLFLHESRVRAVGNIREQFPRADDRPPTLELAGRWCCTG